MPALPGDSEPVCFTPSKVCGLPNVTQVAVYTDRLEVLSGGHWLAFPFKEIAVFQEPRWLIRLKQRLGMLPLRARVADLVYVREPYEQSYIRFFTKPRLTIYMPAGGPALYPESHFWRVQEVLRRGGYA